MAPFRGAGCVNRPRFAVDGYHTIFRAAELLRMPPHEQPAPATKFASQHPPPLPGRRSIRLPGFDYSRGGAYFVTFCTKGRSRSLAHATATEWQLTSEGHAVRHSWLRLESTFPHVRLDALAILPDHVHGLLWIVRYNISSRKPLAPITTVVGVWKSFAARHINLLRNSVGQPVWQRNYFERIVRNKRALEQIREYIRRNRECRRGHGLPTQ